MYLIYILYMIPLKWDLEPFGLSETCINSTNIYLSTYYVPGTVFSVQDAAVNKTDSSPPHSIMELTVYSQHILTLS